jgi:hypothetical protein
MLFSGRFPVGIFMSKELKCEFEIPPHTKVHVVATMDKKLCEEMENIHELEVERAKAEDRTEPDWSNTLEMLFRKGVRAYKQSAEK